MRPRRSFVRRPILKGTSRTRASRYLRIVARATSFPEVIEIDYVLLLKMTNRRVEDMSDINSLGKRFSDVSGLPPPTPKNARDILLMGTRLT